MLLLTAPASDARSSAISASSSPLLSAGAPPASACSGAVAAAAPLPPAPVQKVPPSSAAHARHSASLGSIFINKGNSVARSCSTMWMSLDRNDATMQISAHATTQDSTYAAAAP